MRVSPRATRAKGTEDPWTGGRSESSFTRCWQGKRDKGNPHLETQGLRVMAEARVRPIRQPGV